MANYRVTIGAEGKTITVSDRRGLGELVKTMVDEGYIETEVLDRNENSRSRTAILAHAVTRVSPVE